MNEPPYKTVTPFDRAIGALAKLPDVTSVKATTIVTTSPIIGEAQTFIIQTYRQRDVGDTIFLQYIDAAGSQRIAIPPEAAAAIARQYDALGAKNRKRAARQRAAADKAQGVVPGFMRKKGAKK